jgi:outer membrane protein TolC
MGPRSPLSRRNAPIFGARVVLHGLAVIALAWSAGVARAQAPPTDAEPDTTYLGGEVEVSALGMTLDQAQHLAVDNSPVGRAALAALRSASGSRMIEAGTFDPAVLASGQRVSTDSPVSSPFNGSELRERDYAAGLSWLSPIGTSLAVSLTQSQTESNAPFTTLPTERQTGAQVNFVQPLLKGFGPIATRGELHARDRELDAARLRYDSAVLDVSADVENAYWRLYASEHNLNAQRIQRQRAALFLRDAQLRGRAGVAGPGAVAAARTLLADQEALLLQSRLLARDASDELARSIGISPSRDNRIHCLDDPTPPPPLEPLDAVIRRAFAVNPGLHATEQDTAAARARWRAAEWNAWPTLEAFGSYGGSGLAGISRPIIFGGDTLGTSSETGFGSAWDQVWSNDFPAWSFGLRLVMPIGWRSDRGERERQRGLYEQSQETLRARRLRLEADVRSAYREAESAGATLAAMRELVAATREQARIATLEYQTGRTTAYDLVDIEAQVARAVLRESQAFVDLAHSFTELRRLTQPAPSRAK